MLKIVDTFDGSCYKVWSSS